jgi:hypothetical protein
MTFAVPIDLFANFDSFSEQIYETTFTDDGITFSDWLTSPSSVNSARFSIETTTADLGPMFSPPNFLAVSGFVVGPTDAFILGQLSSMQITFGDVANNASLELFRGGLISAVISLEAYLKDELVASDTAANTSYVNTPRNGIVQRTFSISNVQFDELRLLSIGGTSAVGLDNVRVSLVPEPNMMLGSLVILGFLSRAGCSAMRRVVG